jgi:hypothetical protein
MIESLEEAAAAEKPSIRKPREYKKSSAISQLDEKEKQSEE